MKPLVSHRRAKFDYELLDTFEAGLSLLGTEVKSVRKGQGALEGGRVVIRGNEAFLVGVTIPPFQKANAPDDYDAERPRKLLLSRKELARLENESEKKGLTIVPIKLYNSGQKLKLEIAVARGKKKTDKRETLKKRDTKRDIDRILKNQ